MTTPKRLCVVLLPSPHDAAWREALGAAATAAGFLFSELHDAETALPDPHSDALILCSDAKLVPSMQPTDVVVLTGPADLSIQALIASFGVDYDTALKWAARLYASASDFGAAGATVLNAGNTTNEFPGLGDLTRADFVNYDAKPSSGPLAFYDSLPPKLGASAVWPVTIFNWMDGPRFGRSDLTGRRRLLQHGPYIELSSGEWSIDVKFALTLDRARVDLRFEWGTVADADVASFSISTAGIYSTTLTKVWTGPAIAELRIWLDRSMFDGELQIEECVVRRIA